MITAGLTGGIASGKSTVSRMFAGLGCRIIDADAVAHEVLTWPEVVAAIRSRWGAPCIDPAGSVNRAALGRLIFADPVVRRQLNQLLHPLIRREIDHQLREAGTDPPPELTLVAVPLLIESGEPRRYGPLVLAWCPPEIQLERLVRRDRLTAEEARRRLDAQLPIDGKRALADYIIDTTQSKDATAQQVAEVYRHLRGESPPNA